MDLLDLQGFFFPRFAARKGGYERLHHRRGRAAPGAQPPVSTPCFPGLPGRCRRPEYHRPEYRKVAPECRWCLDLRAAAPAGGPRRLFVDATRRGDTPDMDERSAGLELGYREFLVADRFCV